MTWTRLALLVALAVPLGGCWMDACVVHGGTRVTDVCTELLDLTIFETATTEDGGNGPECDGTLVIGSTCPGAGFPADCGDGEYRREDRYCGL
jgi:hypothetical protein